jgi:hypothetical protein
MMIVGGHSKHKEPSLLNANALELEHKRFKYGSLMTQTSKFMQLLFPATFSFQGSPPHFTLLVLVKQLIQLPHPLLLYTPDTGQ